MTLVFFFATRTLVVRSYAGEANAHLCAVLRDEDGGGPCDDARFAAEVCARVRATPSLAPALDDPQVRAAFRCAPDPPS